MAGGGRESFFPCASGSGRYNPRKWDWVALGEDRGSGPVASRRVAPASIGGGVFLRTLHA